MARRAPDDAKTPSKLVLCSGHANAGNVPCVRVSVPSLRLSLMCPLMC
jgi:hypothetical protein